MKSIFILTIGVFFALANAETETGRIVGGQDAEPHSAPYIVTLSMPDPDFTNYCGGTIIQPTWVVTAARCERRGAIVMIRAGQHNLDVAEPSVQMNLISVFIVHPLYQAITNDIALIKLAIPFVFNDMVKPAVLPPENYRHTGIVNLFGWGSTTNVWPREFPTILQTTAKFIVSDVQCNSIAHGWADETNFCTISLNSESGTCLRDDGSPLVQRRVDGNDELVGIVTWIMNPCSSTPSFFSRVSLHTAWINDVMANN